MKSHHKCWDPTRQNTKLPKTSFQNLLIKIAKTEYKIQTEYKIAKKEFSKPCFSSSSLILSKCKFLDTLITKEKFFYVRCSLSKHTLKKFIPFPFEILSLHICIRLTVLDLCKIFSSKRRLSRSVQSMMVSWPAHFQFFFSFMSWRQFTGFLSVKLREIIHTKN